MSDPIPTVCAWCVAEGSVPEPEGLASHGVCDRHHAQSLAELNKQLDLLADDDRRQRTPDAELSHYEREDVPELAQRNRTLREIEDRLDWEENH